MNGQRGLITDNAPKAATDAPPSAKLVLTVIAHEGSLTQSQLVEETMLPARTIRYALKQLGEDNLVTSEISFMDARQNIYSLNNDWFTEVASR
ncbi:MarR family transcriptional regulator [Natronococcus jeotgali]|uniref:MarR family transcriptional regulator n=1 Tax=Natronococcus jeotgali TaxID=413812 RepID=UPI0009FBDC1F|nr:helix-turn-helix domain-containing protein [Natronococcus jeotgali]